MQSCYQQPLTSFVRPSARVELFDSLWTEYREILQSGVLKSVEKPKFG
jgi:hypothetical protein